MNKVLITQLLENAFQESNVNNVNLIFNFDSSKYVGFSGKYRSPKKEFRGKVLSQIIINMVEVDSLIHGLTVLCHELGHHEHFSTMIKNFDLLHETQEKCCEKKAFEIYMQIENVADFMGRKFASNLGILDEYIKSREEVSKYLREKRLIPA